MKKALFFLAVLCVAGFFSAKAQSPSDSAFVRDLNFEYINSNTLPYTATGGISISANGKILKDLRRGCRATAYTFVLSSSKKIDIQLTSINWDSYLYVLDANYDTVIFNDDWSGHGFNYGSRLIRDFPAGQYYIIVTEYSSGSSSLTYTLTVDEMTTNFTALNSLNYTPLTIGTPVTDTLRTSEGPIVYSYYKSFSRAAYAKAYTVQITNTPCALNATFNRSNRGYLLLDNNYNQLPSNVIRNSGTYRIVAFSQYYFDEDTSKTTPFTITATASPIVNFNTLTYVPLGTFTDTTVNDTFVASFQHMEYDGDLYRVKGYSFQSTQNKVVSINDYYGDAYYVLMDNNHNIIKASWMGMLTLLPQAGTYYLAILDYNDYPCKTQISIKNFPTYYVDGVNGNDSRNGLTPSTALATLDTAVARSGGIGRYYLTENYQFSSHAVNVTFAQIYPYQKDIRLYMPTSGYNDLIRAWPGYLVFGEEGSSYFFIIDSNRSTKFDDLIDADEYSSYIEVNNLKITNSYFPSSIIWGDGVVLRNCEFTNDTFNDYFINIEKPVYGSLKLINCNISQNIFYDPFIYFNYSNSKFSMESTNVVGNTFDEDYPLRFLFSDTVNLISGNWRNNRLSGNYTTNDNANLSAQNTAGIWSRSSKINIGAGFTMDANNYLCIDTASTLNIAENLTASNVAQIYPFYYDESDDKYKANYYEGRRVLWGTSSLLANNYQKFSIAQADNSALWYLHPDGTIHSWPVSIDQAEEGTISLYPNPANNVLNITLQGTELNEAVVIDIYGKTVARTTVSEGNNTLNISALPAGMYFVQLRANNSVKSTQKIIKR